MDQLQDSALTSQAVLLPPKDSSAYAADIDLSPLPKWQRQYLAGLGAGLSDHDARQQAASVSWASVDKALQESAAAEVAYGVDHPHAAFHRAYTMVVQGRRIAGLPQLKEHALEMAQVVLEDAFRESRGRDLEGAVVPHNARHPNRRLILEGVGFVGQGAQITNAIQLNVSSQGVGSPVKTRVRPSRQQSKET